MSGAVVGNYRILEKIGEGGMGAVYRGVDMMLEREVAIKALRPELARQPQLVERFRTEAVTLAKLLHPNIATLFAFFRQMDDFFMVMEFVRGQTLDDTLRKYGALPVERAVPLFTQALEAIDAAHRMGIIHRDIKPANMMLTENGTLKVMDFGIARVLGSARMTKQGSVIGTIEYMSPEQVKGEEADARSDIYSLGILLYEMLTGRVPFTHSSEFTLMKMQIEQAPPPPRNFAQQVPLEIEGAIMRSLAKMPNARFQNALEFRDALQGGMRRGTSPMPDPGMAVQAPRVNTPVDRPMPSSVNTEAATVPMMQPGPGLRNTPPDVPRETRLASDQRGTPPMGVPVKETRMGQGGTPPSGYNQTAPQPYVQPYRQPGAYPVQPYPQQRQKSGTNWKVAGAVIVIVVFFIIAIPIVYLMIRNPDPNPKTNVAPSPTVTPALTNTGLPAPTPVQSPKPEPSSVVPTPTPTPGNMLGQGDLINPDDPGGADKKKKVDKPKPKAKDPAAEERERRRQRALELLRQ